MKRVMMLLAATVIAIGMSGMASAEPKNNDKADAKQAQHKDNKGKDKDKAKDKEKKKHKRFLLF